ncbi:protein FAM133 isoform X2 [Oncorhynchus nerka]|uniref:protein FAM133 isoform X2 n=1 Tax=Oncorhynchus nerka TaxID=8023 RepID=UPI0031B8A7CD
MRKLQNVGQTQSRSIFSHCLPVGFLSLPWKHQSYVNPIAASRANGPTPNAGPSIQDYLSRPRPTWEEVKEIIDRKKKGSRALADFEDQMNSNWKKELAKNREKLLGGVDKYKEKEKKKSEKGRKGKKSNRHSSPSSSSSSSDSSSSSSSDSEDENEKSTKRKKRSSKKASDDSTVELEPDGKGEKSRRKKRKAERSRKDSSSELSADSDMEGEPKKRKRSSEEKEKDKMTAVGDFKTNQRRRGKRSRRKKTSSDAEWWLFPLVESFCLPTTNESHLGCLP